MKKQPELEAAPIKESTEKGYMKAVMAAHRYSQTKRTIDWEDPPVIKMTQIVQDLIEREDLTRETKLVARSALLWFIRSGKVAPNQDSLGAVEILTDLQIPRGKKSKTSRPKAISEEDLSKLLDELYTRAEKFNWAFRSTVWIHAGLACGARPIEWLDAHWSDAEQTTLRIKNAKIKLLAPAFSRNKTLTEDDPEVEQLGYWEANTEDPYREVPLTRESDRSMVETQLQYIREAVPDTLSEEDRQAEFEKYHAACALTVRRACRKLWGNKRTYSLYTLRSQFAANMQAAKGADGAAELMGHSSADSPSAAYYGKWNQAHNRFKASKVPQRQAPVQTQTQTETPQIRAVE